jgi:type II secretory pathway component PulM
MPALPLDEAGKYVAGAYVVFMVLIVVYVAIMAAKLQRIERELRELAAFAEARSAADQVAPGRGSEGSSLSDSLTPHGSGGEA